MKIKLCAGSVVVVSLLAGCESYALGPAALTRQGQEVLIASCVPLALDLGVASYELRGNDTVFWDVEGDPIPIEPGQPISLVTVPEGMSGRAGDIPVDDIDWLIVRLRGDEDDFSAGFDGESIRELEQGDWLQTDGRITREPCNSTPSGAE